MSDSQRDSTTIEVYPPAEAARQLAVSATTQRRMARVYEDVCGDLPRNDRGDRLWTREALEYIASARELHRMGQAVSIEAALQTVTRGEAETGQAVDRSAGVTAEPWERILEELQALRGAVERLTADNKALREELKALPPARHDATTPVWVRWVERLLKRHKGK